MHTKYVLIISAAILFVSFLSCTKNDGGESKLYGKWKLERITTDGVDSLTYRGDIFWNFQNTTIGMVRSLPEHAVEESFGSYRLADQTLFLSFPDPDRPPLLPGLPRQSELSVVKLSRREMVLSWGYPSKIYYFKKW